MNAPADSAGEENVIIRVYPYVFYSPETEFAIGISAISTFRVSKDSVTNPSSVTLGGYYSFLKQYNINLSPEVYFFRNEFLASASIDYGRIVDKFWGTGPEADLPGDPSYVKQVTRIQLRGLVEVLEGIKPGVVFEYDQTEIRDFRQNTLLLKTLVEGGGGAVSCGLGLSLLRDTRNSVFYPSRGGYMLFELTNFSKDLGSDYSFTRASLDLRMYYPLGGEHIIALQGYAAVVGGTPPFFKLAALGGDMIMRGYYQGRYRDRAYAAAQAEYRMHIWRRLGAVAFAGFGNVAESLGSLGLATIKPSVGAGIRFAIDQEEKINLRIDFGVGRDTDGLYFNIKEAF